MAGRDAARAQLAGALLGLGGAAAGALLGLPAGALVGAAVAVALAAALGLGVAVAPRLRDMAFALIGVSLGPASMPRSCRSCRPGRSAWAF